MARPRTIVVHPDELFLSGLELLLAPEFDVVFSTTDFGAALDAVCRYQPSLLVQGLSKQPQIGLALIGNVCRAMPETRIAVVTHWDDATLALDAFRQGAAAYILQTSPVSELLDGLRAILSGNTFVAPELMARMMSFLVRKPQPTSSMSERQIEIVTLLATGKSMKEVAAELHLTTSTVAFHKYTVMRMLNIKTTAELVQYAVQRKLV